MPYGLQFLGRGLTLGSTDRPFRLVPFGGANDVLCADSVMKNIAILGSTGSIGVNALRVVGNTGKPDGGQARLRIVNRLDEPRPPDP